MYCGDVDGPAVHRESNPVSRKDHRCCECGKHIPSKTKYNSFWGLWDGEWAHYATCIECSDIRSELSSCWEFGRLEEDLLELQ